MILLMAFLLPFSTLEMRADDQKADVKIPIRIVSTGKLCRDVGNEMIIAHYTPSSFIITEVIGDLGYISMTVSNSFTGESSTYIFDSANERNALLPISGTPGCYEIEYITESGDVYIGEFLIE